MKSKSNPFLRSATLAAVSSLVLTLSASAAILQWDGGAGTDSWQDANNWNPDAANNDFDGTFINRLNVNGAQKLVYTSNEGDTIYTADGSNFGLVVGSGSSGTMEITSGSFSTVGSTGDVIGNGNSSTGTLTINGGTFIGSTHANGTSLGLGGGLNRVSIMNVSSGQATLGSLVFRSTSATVNLSGTGLLEVNTISQYNTTGVSSYINFDGGTLRALIDSTTFMTGLTTATINGGGAKIDSNGRNITIGQALLAGTGSGGLTKIGTGKLTLTGTNTYIGATTLSAGTLSVGATAHVGAAASNLVFDGGTLQITGTALTSFSGIGHSVSFTSGKDVGLDINSASNTFTADQVLNQGGGGLTKAGAGTLVLNQANSYLGNTLINQGSLVIGSTSSLPGWDTNGRYSVASGTTLAVYNAVSEAEITTMLGTTNFADGATLGFDTTSGNRTFGGTIANTSQGALGLTKLGANALTLSNNNSYTGVTTISGGVLNIQSNSALGTAAGNTTIGSGAKLQLEGSGLSIAENFSVGAGTIENVSGNNTLTGTLTKTSSLTLLSTAGKLTVQGGIDGSSNSVNLQGAGDGEVSGNISTAFQVNKLDAGTWTLSGDNSYTTLTVLSNGILNIQSNTALGSAATGTSIAGNGNASTLELTGDITITGESLNIGARGGAVADVPQVSNVSGDNTWTGDVDLNTGGANYNLESQAGTLTFSGQISAGALTGPRNIRLMGDGDGLISGNIVNGTATVSLAKLGAGTWTLSGTNDYIGATTVTEGTLVIGSTGSIDDSASLSIAAGAELDTTAKSSHTLPATVSIGLDGDFDTSGLINATGQALDIDGATVTFNVTGTLTAPAYVLANYSTLGGITNEFASVTPPSGYELDYAYNSGTQIALVQVTGSAYETWGEPYGLAAGSEGGDLDNDGMTNFEEFAFGLIPNDGSSVNPITVQLNKTAGTFTYQRLKASTSGLTYTIWTSQNLVAWTEDTTAGQSATPVGDNESVVVTLTGAPLTATKLFVRVKAE